jgi:branched-chain amino acid transport system substrate-binding protein
MKLSMIFATATISLAVGFSSDATAQKKYGPGVTDTEIKIGQTIPYSGPLSSLSVSGRSMNPAASMVGKSP